MKIALQSPLADLALSKIISIINNLRQPIISNSRPVILLKFHRFKITKMRSGYGPSIILIGFALFIANPYKITSGRRDSLNEIICNFSIR